VSQGTGIMSTQKTLRDTNTILPTLILYLFLTFTASLFTRYCTAWYVIDHTLDSCKFLHHDFATSLTPTLARDSRRDAADGGSLQPVPAGIVCRIVSSVMFVSACSWLTSNRCITMA